MLHLNEYRRLFWILYIKLVSFIIKGDVDFGATTVYPTAQQLQSLQDIKLIPIALFAITPAYNIAELLGQDPLVFTLQMIADIFLGHITYWNDSAIAAMNPKLKDLLPNQPILVVYEVGSSIIGGKVSTLLSVIPEFNQTVSFPTYL